MPDEPVPIKIDVKISSADFAKFANKVIATIQAPFSRWAKNREPIILAKADAKAALITAKAADALANELEIDKDEAFALLCRGKQRDLYIQIRQQRNLEAIAQGAVAKLPASVNDEPVDEDWTVEFFEQCKNVSNENMQSLWSRLLAGEVAEPGSFSKRTLSFVRSLSQNDADLFTRFCSLVWQDPLLRFMHIRTANKLGLDKYGISYSDLIELDSLGLIKLDMSSALMTEMTDSVLTLYYYGRAHYLTVKNEGSLFPTIKILALTSLGNGLAPISGSVRNEDYRLEAVTLIRNRGIDVSESPP